MKKLLYLFLTGFACLTANLNAQIDTEDVSAQDIAPPSEESQQGPFRFEFTADFIGKTKFDECPDLHHFNYFTGEVEASMVFYYNPCFKEGTSVSVAYQRNRLDWTQNPFFNEKDFDTISLLFSGFTERVQCWQWRAQVALNFDNVPHWTFQDYMNYDLLLWGRYDYCNNIGLHIGFLAQTGMKIDRVYPIIGIDWKYSDKWKFNIIYPINISAIYTIDETWSIAVESRFIDQRHRVKKNEFLSMGLWHYQTSGAELAVNYTPYKWIAANVHAGCTLGGHMTIADRHYKHRHRFRLDAAPYAGAEVVVNF